MIASAGERKKDKTEVKTLLRERPMRRGKWEEEVEEVEKRSQRLKLDINDRLEV